MRTTVTYVRSKKIEKRKAEENYFPNKNIRRHKVGNATHIREYGLEEDETLWSRASLQTTPVLNRENKYMAITQNFLKNIFESLKNSTRQIVPLSIFSKNAETQLMLQSDNKENETPNNFSGHSITRRCLNLPLNENFCLIKEPAVIKKEAQHTKFNFSSLPRYLEHKRSLLRRSKTSTILPSHAICTASDVNKFFRLIEEDYMIALFLKRDVCRRYADKYLLAMVLVYFARAQILTFSRDNFFGALYLAHDMEEDNEDMKFEVFPYCLGDKWKEHYTYLLSIRDDIFWALDCRGVVSKRCCDQVMSLIPNHWLWKRERPFYHADIVKDNTFKEKSHSQPRGPHKVPLCCRACLEKECFDSESSYMVYTTASGSSSEASPDISDEILSKTVVKDSGFESFLIGQNDEEIVEETDDKEELSTGDDECKDNSSEED